MQQISDSLDKQILQSPGASNSMDSGISEDYDEIIYQKAMEYYHKPFLQLVQEAATIHKEFWARG